MIKQQNKNFNLADFNSKFSPNTKVKPRFKVKNTQKTKPKFGNKNGGRKNNQNR